MLAEGHRADTPGLDGIGIREAVEYLHGQRPREEVAEAIAVAPDSTPSASRPGFGTSLAGRGVTLDASRPPDRLAEEIAALARTGRRIVRPRRGVA